jgi:hypothetical protein
MGLIWRLPIQTLVLAFTIVEPEVVANAQPGLGNRLVCLEIDLLLFQAAPQLFHDHIVHPLTLAVHADTNTRCFDNFDEGLAGKLGSLIRIEDTLRPKATDGLIQLSRA